jgi:hypothetical protein
LVTLEKTVTGAVHPFYFDHQNVKMQLNWDGVEISKNKAMRNNLLTPLSEQWSTSNTTLNDLCFAFINLTFKRINFSNKINSEYRELIVIVLLIYFNSLQWIKSNRNTEKKTFILPNKYLKLLINHIISFFFCNYFLLCT